MCFTCSSRAVFVKMLLGFWNSAELCRRIDECIDNNKVDVELTSKLITSLHWQRRLLSYHCPKDQIKMKSWIETRPKRSQNHKRQHWMRDLRDKKTWKVYDELGWGGTFYVRHLECCPGGEVRHGHQAKIGTSVKIVDKGTLRWHHGTTLTKTFSLPKLVKVELHLRNVLPVSRHHEPSGSVYFKCLM